MDAKNTKVLLAFCLIMLSCSNPETEEAERETRINKAALEHMERQKSIQYQRDQIKALTDEWDRDSSKRVLKPIPKK
jgi:hypothetical protein